MDLNYLYMRHQFSFYRTENAGCGRSRRVHQQFVKAYAARIADAKSGAPMLALV